MAFRTPFHASRLALTGVLLALAVAVFVYKAARTMPDLDVYWTAATRAAHAEPLYRPDDGHYQFKYLPAFAVLAIPIGMLPLATAKVVWYAISIVLLVALVFMAIRLPVERRISRGWLTFITVISFSKFYAQELVLGQVNILFAVIATGAFLAMKAQREASAGALVALAIVVKPYAVLFLPWLAARRRMASIAVAGVGCVALLILPAAFYGWEGNTSLHREWWRTVTETTAPNLSANENVSLAALYLRSAGPGVLSERLAYGTSVILLGVAGLVFVKRRAVPFPEGIEGAMLLTLIPLLSPQGWQYVFLIATPAIVYLANYRDLLPRPMRVLTVVAVATSAFSVFDLMGRTAYTWLMQLSIISLCFLVVVAALATLRLRKTA